MKEVAESIKKMASSETMAKILDRGSEPSELELIADTLLDHWSYDLFTRNPGPALLENGVLLPTDLDLACFLSALVNRKAVINLPKYEGRRPKMKTEGEHIVSASNRHGKVMSLSANKEVFSFSIRIEDMNVISSGVNGAEDKVGAPRNFMLVDIDGSWHDGWQKIEFMPDRKENDFLNDKKLWTGNTIFFKNFVHPNRWTSFYGQYFFATKALIARLESQNEFLRKEEKALIAAGITFPTSGEHAKVEWPKKTKAGESKAEQVDAFECEVDVPWKGEFQPIPRTTMALLDNAKRIKYLTYTLLPQLRFATRSTELAFFKSFPTFYKTPKTFPAWIKNAAWEEDYVVPGKRTKWNRLVLTQLYPGQIGFALRFRVYLKTEQVAA